MKNILVVYHYVAHYRVPLFQLLSKSTLNKYTICSGVSTDIVIKTADTELSRKKIKEGGIRWFMVRNIWLFNLFLIQPKIIKLSLSRTYDTIIFLGSMYFITTWIGAILSKLSGKKVIFWTHGFIDEERNFKGFIRSSFYRLADEIMVYGQRAKDILISKGFDEKKIFLIYNSLDYDKQVSIRKNNSQIKTEPFFDNTDIPVFGFIGRLTPQKEPILLIEALDKIIRKGEQANLLIIGSGEQEIILKQKVSELKLEKFVHFFGACYDENVIFQLLKQMKVVVSPGEVGLTAIHALSYGVPVVTHNRFDKQMPEYEVIIPGKTGDFFEFGNIDSMVKMIENWLYRKDFELIVKNCYEVIDDYYNPYIQREILEEHV